MFESISNTEMLWMINMLDQDDRERIEEIRIFIEYLASFINPQAVQEIKNLANNTKQMSDEDFAKTLQQISDEPLDPGLIAFLNKG